MLPWLQRRLCTIIIYYRVCKTQWPSIVYDNEIVILCMCVLGSTVVTPYVGMARKQNGGYNASISVQTPLVHLVANCTHPKTVRSAL